MKVTAIGDIHGRDNWKDIINRESDSNCFVFHGDYFDSRDISSERQQQNFLEIKEFQHKNKKKVYLLIGNHDFHYTPFQQDEDGDKYPGHQEAHHQVIEQLIGDMLKERRLMVSVILDKVLYTHAGVTSYWCKKNNIIPNSETLDRDINTHFIESPQDFNMEDSFSFGRSSGDGPFWVRPPVLEQDAIKMKQVVGHSKQDRPPKEWMIQAGGNIAVIDALEHGYYLNIINGEFYIQNL